MNIVRNMFTNLETIKVLGANTTTYAVLYTFTDIDDFFKLLLVVVSVVYSALKCIALFKREFTDNNKEDETNE